MRFLNPLAFLGLATVLVPVVLHFLAQHRARELRFPTLRFVPESTPVPSWSARPTDRLLLLVRTLVLIAAVAALAGPVVASGTPGHQSATTIRAVILDTASLDVGTIDSVRAALLPLSDSAGASRIFETGDVPMAVPAALAWLNAQSGSTRELAVVSEFRKGRFVVTALPEKIPEAIGVSAIRVPQAQVRTGGGVSSFAGRSITIAADVRDGATVVHYGTTRDAATVERSGTTRDAATVERSGTSDETGHSRGAAARLIGPDEELSILSSIMDELPHWVSGREGPAEGLSERIMIIFPEAREWGRLREGGSLPEDAPADRSRDEPDASARERTENGASRSSGVSTSAAGHASEFAREIVRLQRDPLLAEAARSAKPLVSVPGDDGFLAIAVNAAGESIVDARIAERDSHTELRVFVNAAMLSDVSVALLEALRRDDGVYDGGRIDTATFSDSALRAMSRPALPEPSAAGANILGIRALWVLVLILLAAEAWLRRAGTRP